MIGKNPKRIAIEKWMTEDSAFELRAGESGDDPVSYTHLDVYKRQCLKQWVERVRRCHDRFRFQ